MAIAMNKSVRLWGALVLTVAACIWVSLQEDSGSIEMAVPVKTHVNSKSAQIAAVQNKSMTVSDQLSPALLQQATYRSLIMQEPQDLFDGDPEVQAADLATSIQEKQNVPPLPYVFGGRVIEDGQTTLFLLAGERNLTARLGDVIDRVWRVESINLQQVVFRYLPIQSEVVLVTGENN